jgi:flagellar hook protein FlgE
MYSGISGMRANQTKLDVIGNNVANVGTTAFKCSRVRFSDMLSQTMTEAIGPGRNQGGVNGSQVGLGVQIAGVDNIMQQGHMQPTSRNLDVGMDGVGYFMVARLDVPKSNEGGMVVDSEKHNIISANGMEISFTRDGSFTLDHEGNLLTSDGGRILGYALHEKDGSNADTRSIDYSRNGLVSYVNGDMELVAESNLVPLRIPDFVHVNATTNPKKEDGTTYEAANMDYNGTGKTDVIEGNANIKITNTKPPENTYKGAIDLKVEVKWVDEPDTKPTGGDWADGAEIKGGWRVFISGKEICAPSDTAINLDEDGKVTSVADDMLTSIVVKPPTGTKLEALSDNEKANYNWSFTLKAEADRKVRSFSIEKDGVIKGVLQDGTVAALGQIASASFKNPEGLKKLGRNLYERTANSGAPMVRSGIGAADINDNSDGYGAMLQGMLEMSNVDLAEQFTDMIVTSRAFQASSKMISTGDEILQDIINLKR